MKKITISDFNYYSGKNYGHCKLCNSIQEGGCEPDAEDYTCDYCGENGVDGFENAMISGELLICEDGEEDELFD